MNSPQLHTQSQPGLESDRERARRLRGALTEVSLRNENVLYARTRGVSRANRGLGFVPGYLDTASGAVARSCFADGKPAPVHVLDGLPESWILDRGPDGHVTAVRPGIVAGFIRDGRFYTREEACRATAH